MEEEEKEGIRKDKASKKIDKFLQGNQSFRKQIKRDGGNGELQKVVKHVCKIRTNN